MAKKRFNSSSYGGRFQKYAKCGSMVAADAAKALRIARKLKSMINVEYKTVQVGFKVDPNTTPQILHLSATAQGDTLASRDGNKIKAFSIQLKGCVSINASAVSTLTRFLVFLDHANTGTPPVITDLFSSAASFTNGESRVSDPQSNSRFIVLKDIIILQSDQGPKISKVNFYKRLHHHIKYIGAATTDEGMGTVWVFQASNEATNDPVVNVKSTFKWIDN